jgi:tetratricopeptide (TPR) repeat protein
MIDRRRYKEIRPLLIWTDRSAGKAIAGDIAVLALGMALQKLSDPEDRYRFLSQVNWLPWLDSYCLDQRHLLIKHLPKAAISSFLPSDLIPSLVSGNEIQRHPHFKAEELQAELIACQIAGHDDEPPDFLSFLFRRQRRNMQKENDRIRIKVLESSITFSQHNPAIMIELIELYRKHREKRSRINRVVEMLLSKFPDNADGYRLAGEIAQANKTYKKAITYFSRACELAPLNRELVLTLLQCYEGIIDKRSRKDAHLIDQDLEQAACRIQSSQPLLEAFGLLKAKAILKKVSTHHLKIEAAQQQMSALLKTELQQAGAVTLFQLIRLISQERQEGHFEAVMTPMISVLKTGLTPTVFASVLKTVLDDSTEGRPAGPLFFELLVDLIRNDQQAKQITIEQYSLWMIACLKTAWYRTFFALLLSAGHGHPNHRFFLLLLEILQQRPNRLLVKQHLTDRPSNGCSHRPVPRCSKR